jgi:hypothetical protein
MSCYRPCNASKDCPGRPHNSQKICKVCGQRQNPKPNSLLVAQPATSSRVAPNPVHLGAKPLPKKSKPNPSVALVSDQQASGSGGVVPSDTTNPAAIVQPSSQVETSERSELHVDDTHECHVPHDISFEAAREDVPQRAATPSAESNALFLEAYQGLLRGNEGVKCLFVNNNVACITLPDCERGVPLVLQVTVTVVNRFTSWV